MKRREFITLLGGAATWPLGPRAQQAKLRTIGFLGPATPSMEGLRTAAFAQSRGSSWSWTGSFP